MLAGSRVEAMPAYPFPRTTTLFDGSEVTYRVVGDHHAHLMLLEDFSEVVVHVPVHEDGTPSDEKTGLWDLHVAEVNTTGFPKTTGL